MRTLTFVLLPLMGLFLAWYAATTPPRQRDILHALRMADTVTITEFRRGPLQGGYSEPLTEKMLNKEERSKLLACFIVHGLGDKKPCPFDPHHRIDCDLKDGRTVVIQLSFGCDEYALNEGASYAMGPWSELLKETLPQIGIPIRPERYLGTH